MINKIIKENLILFKSELDFNIGIGTTLASICLSMKTKNKNDITDNELNNFLYRSSKNLKELQKINKIINNIDIPTERNDNRNIR